MIAVSIGFIFSLACLGYAMFAFNNGKYTHVYISVAISVLIFGVALGVSPYVKVWQAALSGEALLKEAEWSRQIKIKEAMAAKEAASAYAEAEVIRAKGAAEANRIVADGLGGPEGYLRYLAIEAMKETLVKGNTVVYVPTEANIPITEAMRYNKPHTTSE